MGSPNTVQNDLRRAAEGSWNRIADPGDGEAMMMNIQGDAVCVIDTQGTSNETRGLPPPDGQPLGVKLTVVFGARDGGGTPNITLQQTLADASLGQFDASSNTDAVMAAPGAALVLQRLTQADGKAAWRLVSQLNTTFSA